MVRLAGLWRVSTGNVPAVNIPNTESPYVDVMVATGAELSHPDNELVPLVGTLEAAGFGVEVAAWDDPAADWGRARAVLIRSTWGYHERLDEFLAWAEAVSQAAQLWNPFSLVRWNTHKQYLLDLAEAGVPVVPTEFVRSRSQGGAPLGEIAAARGWADVVVKPAVSAGAFETHKGAAADVTLADEFGRLAASRDMLIQQFLSEVATSGEVSLVCIEGTPMHAVRKVPAVGDYRSQAEYGSSITETIPTGSQLAVASACFGALGTAPLYARVDMIDSGRGPMLVELELIEPYLFTAFAESGQDTLRALASGLSRRLGR